MSSSLRMRVMLPADLTFADSLRAMAGWNQTPEDWRRFMAMEPHGCFVAEWNGQAAGTATTVLYGKDLAWIGMVLVHPDFRRRGIGTGLLVQCIEYLQARQVRCIKLDATPQGRPCYEKLGFKDEWTLRRWEGEFSALAAAAGKEGIRTWTEADAARIDAMDSGAFGASRRELLSALARQSYCALALEPRPGVPEGFGMLRWGSRAFYLGPVTATSAQAGLVLVGALAARTGGARVYWDIPDLNEAAVEWAARHGLSVQRSLTRMWLGDNSTAGDPRRQFAIAAPELG
jgi:ribosomal protein S18 acetylase RimI-like enzyme